VRDGDYRVCGTSQIAVNGRCVPCDYGRVSNAAGSACVKCSDESSAIGGETQPTAGGGTTGSNMVKFPDGNNVANAVCVMATSAGACGTSQIAVNGRCSPCDYGRVSNAVGDTCVKCSDESTNGDEVQDTAGGGTTGPNMVKSPDGNNVAGAICVEARSEGACGTIQIAVNGRCSSCSYNQVSNGFGDACIACSAVPPQETSTAEVTTGPTMVKSPNSNSAVDATCVSTAPQQLLSIAPSAASQTSSTLVVVGATGTVVFAVAVLVVRQRLSRKPIQPDDSITPDDSKPHAEPAPQDDIFEVAPTHYYPASGIVE